MLSPFGNIGAAIILCSSRSATSPKWARWRSAGVLFYFLEVVERRLLDESEFWVVSPVSIVV
jgi:hypothetical protein